MHDFLGAAVAVLAALVMLNLVLTLAMIRRIRTVDEAIHATGEGDALPAVGSAVGQFVVATSAGGMLSSADLSHGVIDLVVLTPTCKPCVELARQLSDGTDRLPEPIVIILGTPGDTTTDAVAALLPSQLTIGFSDETTVGTALSVTGYPAVLRLRDGVVEDAAHSLDLLGRRAATAAGR